jgi:hypothetical protein
VKYVVHYVDDYFFAARLEAAARAYRDEVSALCAKLGIPIADSKTEGPTQCLTFLGIELDTVAMEARLSATRLAELQTLISTWDSVETADSD